MSNCLCVLVPTPAHSALGPVLTYRSPQPLPLGTLVRVPLGKREILGVVWEPSPSPALATADATSAINPDKLRDVAGVLQGIAPLGAAWQQLVRFAAQYYQRSVGEVALAALPPQLRDLSTEQIQRKLRRKPIVLAANGEQATPAPHLSAEQADVLAQIQRHSGPFLLFGATGSGKTEVYLRAVEDLLAHNPQAQALVMVPEINLTPQLEARFLERFASLFGAQAVVSLHSGMTPAQRLTSWLAAHSGSARIVLGTRMAVFASLPGLRLIVVDEEHDPSYKSSEGARYSARDLAVYRGKLQAAKVLLGSATPSLESWHHSRPVSAGGRYQRLLMPSLLGHTPQAVPGAA
ncbi:MAG: DEAD/DEAH box helicase, partial [Rhodoferax sp.]|nr:DEAD/DEAH box helicase [Rhodoferax sp.]